MKTATIIIPTFNRAKLIHRAIESAIYQTYPCEVIVCDHGSTDNTPEVVAKYQDKIRYIRKEEDKGPIICWRDGLENSTGEIIHFNYDDDWMEPDFMEKTIELLLEDVGFVYSRARIHNENKDTTLANVDPPGIKPMIDIVRYLLQTDLTISPGCAIFRKQDALKNLLLEVPDAEGPYGKNSGVGEDLLLFLLASLDYSKYAHIDKPLVHFLAHDNSITINALDSGRDKEIISAYENAKKYYCSCPGSFRPLKRHYSIPFKILWKLKAGILLKESFGFLKNIN